MAEQKQSDPVREMFEKEIQQLDHEIQVEKQDVDSLSKRLSRAQESLDGKVAGRRAIIDAMQKVCNPYMVDADEWQKVCNVAVAVSEEQAIAKPKDLSWPGRLIEGETGHGITVQPMPVAPIGAGVNADLHTCLDHLKKKQLSWLNDENPVGGYTKVTGHAESPICPLSELGISATNPARQPQKDFVVRFKCGCCVRFRDDYQMTENCRMENGCYSNADSANIAWDWEKGVETGKIPPSSIDPNIVSAKWEQPK